MSAASSDQVKQLKRQLEVWREAVLPIHAILVWEQPWHPGLLVGISSAFFLLFWYLDPSVLTTLAFLGLVLTIGDYVIHLFGSYNGNGCAESSDKWTGKNEKKLEEVCQNIVTLRMLVLKNCSSFFGMRHTRPKTYYASTISMLVLLSWLGCVVNNLFLTYLFVTFVLLLPGMKHQGILQRWISSAMLAASQALKGGAKTVGDKKVK